MKGDESPHYEPEQPNWVLVVNQPRIDDALYLDEGWSR